MSIERDPHPPRDQLAAFDAGLLGPTEREAVEHHLVACPLCGRVLDSLPEDPFVALVRASAGHSAPTLAIAEGTLPGIPDALARHPRYRVLEVLGSGGMGTVYKAVHRVMDRVVALKVLHRRFTAHPDFVERFRQEARTLARLSHPHIALAHDAEQAGDLHFLVMEYVPGMSLDRFVAQRGPLGVAEACDSVRQAALGLQHAFENGITHRDVKPQNLMRTPDGRVKVLDFGLAQLARESGEEQERPSEGFAGTPDYTAPEQARDPASADIRADVYGLGCTLRFLLTGQPPFPGGSTLQKLMAHQERRPSPLSQLRGDVPASLTALLERMMAKDPALRPTTPAEVVRALAPFAGSAEELPAAHPRRPRRLLWLVLPAAALLILTVGVFLVRVWPRPSPSTETAQPDDTTALAPLDPLALATPEQMVRLREERCNQALAWLDEHGHPKRRRGLVRETAAHFARYPGQVDGFHILLGSQWLEGYPAGLLVGSLGGLFVYPLTPAQVRQLDMKDGTRYIRSCHNPSEVRRAVPRVRVSDLKLAGGPQLDLYKRVPSSINYDVCGPPIREDFAVRLGVFIEGGRRRMVLQWFKGRTLEGRGTLQFSCPPLASPGHRPCRPVVVFADICTDDGSILVESDAAAVLVEAVKPSL
jgi:hypothetical protein